MENDIELNKALGNRYGAGLFKEGQSSIQSKLDQKRIDLQAMEVEVVKLQKSLNNGKKLLNRLNEFTAEAAMHDA
eukprot:CAMPEP_0117421252 /NCGR_PEP_ID=MMETSP0758-20121206/2399_1 /TAXON_ID=63605 /ORGANISM="Percolomonas cosmopolitus, Strain AE-1 (ATCC 50343)" /LENGTH=74 /DNA_ID=CAMNT_0005203301 /DNA_START=82 /DNA_END=306 /DNA_ORIENTATION=-